jgi:hypothetical protein
MKRPIVVAILAVIAAIGAAVWLQPDRPPAPAPTAVSNPSGYVASDVALLARTGRPQLVEVFRYG